MCCLIMYTRPCQSSVHGVFSAGEVSRPSPASRTPWATLRATVSSPASLKRRSAAAAAAVSLEVETLARAVSGRADTSSVPAPVGKVPLPLLAWQQSMGRSRPKQQPCRGLTRSLLLSLRGTSNLRGLKVARTSLLLLLLAKKIADSRLGSTEQATTPVHCGTPAKHRPGR